MTTASDQPTAFPRGKRKQSTSTSTSTTLASSSSSKKDVHQPSKKRATSTASTTASASSSTKEQDFLFGNTDQLNATLLLNKKSQLQRSNPHKSAVDGYDLDSTTTSHYNNLTPSTSTLPLGGGSVLPSSTNPTSGKRIPPKIEALTFGKFAPGTKVLGVIREVCEEYAVVSLPTMLTGFVLRGDGSGGGSGGGGVELTKVLPPVNTIMAFYVVSTTTEDVSKRDQKKNKPGAIVKKKRRIELSVLPVHVNKGVRVDDYLLSSPSSGGGNANANDGGGAPMVVRGRIVSMEDHGCIVDLGGLLSGGNGGVGRRAFLKFDNVEGDYEIDDDESSDDEDEEDDEEDARMDIDGSKLSKRKLNPHRIYDFAILPSNTIDPSSSSTDGSSSSQLPTIIQLALPLPTTLAKLPTTSTMMPGLSTLQPGMLINDVSVEAYAKNGLCVHFNGGVYRGCLDEDHLGGHRGVDDFTGGGNSSGGGKKKKGSKRLNMDGSDPSMWWKSVFKGRFAKFTARIIAVDTTTKIVRFSLNPHILALRGELAIHSFPHAIGAIIKNAQVIRVDPGVGALLALPPLSTSKSSNGDDGEEEMEEEEKASPTMEEIAKLDKELSNNLLTNSDYRAASKVHTAYVHISKSMDNNNTNNNDTNKNKGKNKSSSNKNNNNRTPEALFARHFSINTTIKSLRILSTSNLIDNIASCATSPSIVNAHVLTHADIVPGKVYKDVPVIQLLESGGVLVDLGVGTKGLIPSMHLFDKASHGSLDNVEGSSNSGYRQKIRQAKYKVGNLVTVRCLTVNSNTRQCVLTAKKTLVSDNNNLGSGSGGPPIVDYTSSSITLDKISPGFISKVDDHGLTVTFYNNVHGRVSSRSLASELGVEDPKLNYTVGDVVVARVVDCVRRRKNRNNNKSHGGDEGEDDEEDLYYYQLRLSLKTVLDEKKKNVEEEEEEEKEEKETATAVTTTEEESSTSKVVPLAPGSVLMPKRMKVLQLVNCLRREYDGAFLPGYAVVSIKSKFFTNSGGGNNASSAAAVECKLPYDQLLDSYNNESLSNPPMELDDIAARELTVGKRIDAEGLILTVPNGVDALPIVTLRTSLIDTIKKQQASSSSTTDTTKNDNNSSDDLAIICPSPKSNLFMGEYVRGYVTRLDPRFGAFVRFLDGLTGLIPKLKKGLNEQLYDTILCKVTALDVTSSPRPKILLKKVGEGEIAKKRSRKSGEGGRNKSKGGGGADQVGRGGEMKVGHVVGSVKVADINFARAKVYLVDSNATTGGGEDNKLRARIHVTMANALPTKSKLSKKEKQFKEEHKIGKSHPFYNWKVGDIIPDVRCVALDNRDGVSYVELSNLNSSSTTESSIQSPLPLIVSDPSHLPPGSVLSAIVTSISSTTTHHGLWVQVCPGISGFVPALEASTDPDVLNDLASNYKVGTRITCSVMDRMSSSSSSSNNNQNKKAPPALHGQNPLHGDDDHDDVTKEHHQALELSVLLVPSNEEDNSSDKNKKAFKPTKPHRGDVAIGRIQTKSRSLGSPSLMLNLRGGFMGRCCVTELVDVDDWENMPLGKAAATVMDGKKGGGGQQRVVSDSDVDHSHNEEEDDDDASDDDEANSMNVQTDYPDGKYVKCRVLGSARSKAAVEVSLRDSRLEGNNLEDDPTPDANDMVHAYVVSTTKMGCFVRLSRSVEGRVILKELSDEFIPNPSAMFPPGRLVVGKVKLVKESNNNGKNKKNKGSLSVMVDMDMRESVLLTSGDRLTIDDIKENSKYTGIITRVESYGAFVRIDNSDVSGLAHVSECSDTYIKNIYDLYNPGDLVKVMVITMDEEGKRLGFSLKASNFVGDEDSDDDDSSTSSGSSDDSSSSAMEEDSDGEDEKSIDSEDEDFASKLAKKMEAGEGMDVDEESTGGDSSSSEGSSSDSESSDSEDESEEEVQDQKGQGKSLQAMETDVGFDWGATTTSKPTKTSKLDESSDDESSSSEDESDDDADSGFKSSHKARKKAAAKRREEEETSRREAALADGTADETPETSADFERLIASSPNSSEVWIKYMAFHLSLADIDSARTVANRAFERIEFRQEGEKLNVWTALLTLELKYGTNKSLHKTVDRACQQNNPKQVYLRVCELLDKEVDASASASGLNDLDTATTRADEMFTKMCKKFKSKKSVWIAHFQYLLKGSRHEEAHALLKRSLQSLPTYKHVEVMSKFAQMEFELGSPERGRTIFNALLEKHPKRMDLLFVNIDKEVKNGDMVKARALFDSVVNPVSQDKKFKFSDKQMKSLFKKWYRMEEDHGDEESQERVKEEARAFVAKTN